MLSFAQAVASKVTKVAKQNNQQTGLCIFCPTQPQTYKLVYNHMHKTIELHKKINSQIQLIADNNVNYGCCNNKCKNAQRKLYSGQIFEYEYGEAKKSAFE